MKSKSNLIWPILVVILTLLMYLRTLCPVIYGGDSAMHAYFSQTGPFASNTPNPVFHLFSFILTRLPLASAAMEANLVSAIFGVLTILVLYFILARQTENPIIAASASLLVAFGATFWKVSTFAESYTFTTFLIAIAWWITLKPECSEGKPCIWKLILPPILLGLAIIDEPIIVFLLPGLIVYHILSKSPKLILRIALLVIFGIIAASGYVIRELSAGLETTYGSWLFTFQSSDGAETLAAGSVPLEILKSIFLEWGPIFFFVTIGGFIYLLITNPKVGWGMVVSIIGMIIGVMLFKGSTDLLKYGSEYRIALMLPFFGFGFAFALKGAYGRLTSSHQLVGEESFIPKDKVPHFINAFYLAFPVLLLLFHLGSADSSNRIFVDKMIGNALKGTEAPATLICGGDEYYPFKLTANIAKWKGGLQDDELFVTRTHSGSSKGAELISFIEEALDADRNCYLSFEPFSFIAPEGIHFEHDGLLYKAVRDDDPDAVNDGRDIPFSNPGHEADVWESYDREHLSFLNQYPPDFTERPYLKRYYDELADYGSFAFEIENYLLSRLMLAEAWSIGGFLELNTDSILPNLAMAGYKVMDSATPALFELAYERGVGFPERDVLRANFHFYSASPLAQQLGAESYAAGDTDLLDAGLIEILLGADIDQGDYEAAKEKALLVIARYDGFTEEQPVPVDPTAYAIALAQNQKIGDLLWHLAFISHHLDDYETVTDVIQLLVNLSPGILNDKLSSMVVAQDFENAVVFYEIAVELAPEDWRSVEGYAICLFELGEEDRAKELASAALEHRPDSKNLKGILGLEIEDETPPDEPETAGGE